MLRPARSSLVTTGPLTVVDEGYEGDPTIVSPP
jgi:hypothetical protein